MEVNNALEKLKLRFKATKDALNRLEEGIDDLSVIEKNYQQRTSRIYRNSLVLLFGITYDLFWKYTKDYVLHIHGFECNSPKSVFRECFKIGIITNEETSLLLSMVDDRNKLIHTYNEEVAIQLSFHVSSYYSIMKKLLEELIPSEALNNY